MNDKTDLLRVEKMNKSFGVTRALRDVSIRLEYGQILGLIGENGSGKSTLSSIVARMQLEDSGEMFFEGQPYHPKTAVEANRCGICMILQEKGTFELMSVARNIFIGKEDMFQRMGLLNNKKMVAAARDALASIHADYIKADALLSELSFEDRKLVELARAMYTSPKVLIVDETTTALSKAGREILYQMMNNMKAEGKSVIFITHDIDEMIEVCDKISVLRDGVYVGSLEKEEFEASKIKKMMVGRDVAENFYRSDLCSSTDETTVLSVNGVSGQTLRNVQIDMKKGEILGIGGLTDSGMHELGKVAFGAVTPDSGNVKSLSGTVIDSPKKAMRERIAYISKDRDQESLMITASIKDNINLPSYEQMKAGVLISPAKEKSFACKWADTLSVKMQDVGQYVMELSGGNKQKVALAKWLGFGADIFILDCPTRGIDIGVKENIYHLMMELRGQGKSILLISEELTEVIGMSDRVVTLKDGSVSGEFTREENLSEGRLIEYII